MRRSATRWSANAPSTSTGMIGTHTETDIEFRRALKDGTVITVDEEDWQ